MRLPARRLRHPISVDITLAAKNSHSTPDADHLAVSLSGFGVAAHLPAGRLCDLNQQVGRSAFDPAESAH